MSVIIEKGYCTCTGDSKLTSGTVDSRGTDSTSYSDAERFEEHTDLPLAARGRNPKRSVHLTVLGPKIGKNRMV